MTADVDEGRERLRDFSMSAAVVLNCRLFAICRFLHVSTTGLIATLFLVAGIFFTCGSGTAANAAERYALVVGITKYRHASLNDPPLRYPEADAEAVAALLEKSGYKVTRLLGNNATTAKVTAALEGLGDEGSSDGVAVVGLFGHGVQFADDAYFCTYDAKIRVLKDSAGNTLRTRTGSPKQEPDPGSIVSMRQILDALAVCGAGGKLLLADCCRNDPNAARGRAFGTDLKLTDLPTGMVAIFACSANERAFEHADWSHGAFTRALLDACAAKQNVSTVAGLLESIQRDVQRMVAEKVGSAGSQNVHFLMNGNVNLGLAVEPRARVRPSLLRVPFTAEEAAHKRLEWADYLEEPTEFANSIGTPLVLVPPGEFIMGSANPDDKNIAAHPVRITRPLYVSKVETSVGEFRKFVAATNYRTTAEQFDNGQNRGWVAARGRFEHGSGFNWRHTGWQQDDRHPVVNVSWEDAAAFVRWLSAKEGRTYRLLTEAEWEYCCRAGTATRYAVGDDPNDLVNVANVLDRTGFKEFSRDSEFNREGGNDVIDREDGHVFTMVGGSLQTNSFGLADFHGNVCEWCHDLYAEDYGGQVEDDPQGAVAGATRCARGGRFDTGRYLAQSFARNSGDPRMTDMILGFRIALEVRE